MLFYLWWALRNSPNDYILCTGSVSNSNTACRSCSVWLNIYGIQTKKKKSSLGDWQGACKKNRQSQVQTCFWDSQTAFTHHSWVSLHHPALQHWRLLVNLRRLCWCKRGVFFWGKKPRNHNSDKKSRSCRSKFLELAPFVQWWDLCEPPCFVYTSHQREDATIINRTVISLSPQNNSCGSWTPHPIKCILLKWEINGSNHQQTPPLSAKRSAGK